MYLIFEKETPASPAKVFWELSDEKEILKKQLLATFYQHAKGKDDVKEPSGETVSEIVSHLNYIDNDCRYELLQEKPGSEYKEGVYK